MRRFKHCLDFYQLKYQISRDARREVMMQQGAGLLAAELVADQGAA